MINVMADNVDDDICSYIGNSNSTSTANLKQIDSIQSNHQQQQKHHHPNHHHQNHHHHHHQQQLSDTEHINNVISNSSEVSKYTLPNTWE